MSSSSTTVQISDAVLDYLNNNNDGSKENPRLNVCCYGSSSSATPEMYLQQARDMGYLLAKRGHVCVNGAGSFGCMAALNDGAVYGNGSIIGVIHEMWMTTGEDAKYNGMTVRDGGAHDVFADIKSDGMVHREIIVARGKDLQERKRLLVENANALVVLPGGPGTWDELWEMACARNIGLSTLPIVCVNVEGYYEPFKTMLERAYKEELTKTPPEQLVHFCDTALEAMQWVEANATATTAKVASKPKAAVRKSSLLHFPSIGRSSFSFWSQKSNVDNSKDDKVPDITMDENSPVSQGMLALPTLLVFAVGFGLGLMSKQRESSIAKM